MRIYLDHNATTPLRQEVIEAMAKNLRDCFGNPSSTHREGGAARAALEGARERVAALVGARTSEIVFTAGATEANNSALRHMAASQGPQRGHWLTSTVEHPSVVAPLEAMAEEGWRVRWLPVDAAGRLDVDEFDAALEDEACLVSILWANNETGVLQPIETLVARAKARGARVHVDATQALGKIPVDVGQLPVDFLSASGHKLNAAKGVGFLFIRDGQDWTPWIRGGPQERRRRGGTENLAGAVGLGVACELAHQEIAERGPHARALRDRLWEGIAKRIPRVRINGSVEHRLPNTLNVEFERADGEILLEALDLEAVAVSAGAACHSGSTTPSHVLRGMGLSDEAARASLRFSVGHGVDEAQIDRVLDLLPDLVARARDAWAA